jgi:hypothetical protein
MFGFLLKALSRIMETKASPVKYGMGSKRYYGSSNFFNVLN